VAEGVKDMAASVNKYRRGLQDGVSIGLGYLPVSFAFGLMASAMKFPVWAPVLISMTNLTSAGQFAALPLIAAGAPLLELVLTQWVINLRYALMSLSLTQKFDGKLRLRDRLLMAFFITDEIFAVAGSREGLIGRRYYFGLATAPYVGWAVGTLLGAVAGELLPLGVRSALGMAIYAMFIAIILPPARDSRPIAVVVAIAAALSCLFYFTPGLKEISSGFVIILCTLTAAALGAWLFPLRQDRPEGPLSFGRQEDEEK
jgi:4-azaleucine resistance transporter AzlC